MRLGVCWSYRHIVLAVHFNGCYGALGLSRRKNLMYKPLTFKVRIFVLKLLSRWSLMLIL